MNKGELIEAVSTDSGVTKKNTAAVVDHLIGVIRETCAGGAEVQIAGLGKFVPKLQAARTVRNPRTGDTVHVSERQGVKFKAAKAFTEALNG